VSELGVQLIERTNRFALNVLGLLKQLPETEPGPTVRRQLAKSATSVAANYRASRRSRSHTEFTARIALVAEEADESLFWLNLVASADLAPQAAVTPLRHEANELAAIFSACVRTARLNRRRRLKS
jgi:four helix bundle protein